MEDAYLSDVERATLARIALAAEDARSVMERALDGLKVGAEPSAVIGQAVDVLLATDILTRACHDAWVAHEAAAAVE